jgi:hypothetical protein
MKMPPQILRLVLLTFAIVGSYAVARAFLTPPSFRQYGWFRGDALQEIAARKPLYAGKKACDECHSDEIQKLAKGEHKSISCESCHGPAQAHADNPDLKTGMLTDSDCLRCHEADPGRPNFLKQITVKSPYKGSRCVECHVPHHPSDIP